jgi:hypothetical protein
VVAAAFLHFVHVGNMGAKQGIRKGASRILKTEGIKGPAHQNYYEREGRRVPNRAMIHLNKLFATLLGFIFWLNGITDMPETNFRRWQTKV